mgnify:CR=1 FL=1
MRRNLFQIPEGDATSELSLIAFEDLLSPIRDIAEALPSSPLDVVAQEALAKSPVEAPWQSIVPAKDQKNFSDQLALTINFALGSWYGLLWFFAALVLSLLLRRMER